ncbi:hypothetical protein B7C42_05009 [Nocardia cerradoensis]|uniref:Uncharacterized protein n=1 Tax=Nocardia cerradoensis TaxID=85688 RepID=A0A231H2N2_9NOCA|nr:hypothetical protein B7C42_05009 [Nocardia cerradoensis]
MPDTPAGAAGSVPVPQRLADAPVSAGMVVPYLRIRQGQSRIQRQSMR